MLQTVPGAFRVLVDVLKKDRNTRYISCNLEDCKKQRDKFLQESRKRRVEKQMLKAQDTLMYQVGYRLAPLAIGRQLRSLEVHTFEHHVAEASKMIDILEKHKVDIEFQEGSRESLSLPQLSELRQQRQNRRYDEIRQRNKDILKEREEFQLRINGLTHENERLVKHMEADKENMRLWTERRFENSKNDCEFRVNHAKEEMAKKFLAEKQILDDQFSRERQKKELELMEVNKKYDRLLARCRCMHAKKDFNIQVDEQELIEMCKERERSMTSAPPCLSREMTNKSEVSRITSYHAQISVEPVQENTILSQHEHIHSAKTIINNYVMENVTTLQIGAGASIVPFSGKTVEEVEEEEEPEH